MMSKMKVCGIAGAMFALGTIGIMSVAPLSAQNTRVTGQLAACPKGKTINVEITKSEGSSTLIISAKVGDQVRVELPTQSGTGYAWFMSLQEKALVGIPGVAGTAGKDVKPGGPSKTAFTALMTAPGTQNFYFRYVRPWETGKPPAGTAAVRVRIAAC